MQVRLPNNNKNETSNKQESVHDSNKFGIPLFLSPLLILNRPQRAGAPAPAKWDSYSVPKKITPMSKKVSFTQSFSG